MKKQKTTTEKPVPKAEQLIASVVTKATPKKAQAVAPKPIGALPGMTNLERVGMTAGWIWRYLAENGATPVAKLVRELPEEDKIIQRSIGWLAQEGKITFDPVDRVETIVLKE
jgi:hypothetical protein